MVDDLNINNDEFFKRLETFLTHSQTKILRLTTSTLSGHRDFLMVNLNCDVVEEQEQAVLCLPEQKHKLAMQ